MIRFDDIPAVLSRCAGDDSPALTFYRGRTLTGRLSRRELYERVEAVAGYLWEALDVRAGDRIAVLAPNRLEVPVLMLAAMRLGAVVVPLNPTAPSDDWSYIVGHARVRGCFASEDLVGEATFGTDVFVRPIDELAHVQGVPPAPGVDLGGAKAVVLYTSGTTGRPKGVVLTQHSLLANAQSMAVTFGLSRTTQLAVLPLYHAHALGFGLMTSLCTHGHLVFAERFDPFAWSELICAHDVTITSVVPTLLPPLLQIRLTAERVPSLRAILVSSAPLSVELAREFEHRTKLRLVQGWGLSEYTNFACCMAPDEESAARDQLMFGFEVPSVGSALPGTEVRVIDATGAEVPHEVRGELCVRGHSAMLSYLDDPDATVATIGADGWLRTGDEGYSYVHADKVCFFVSGRIKEIIIRGGEKHSPVALERIITAAVPELAGRFAILGFAHAIHGEEIGAYVESGAASDPDVIARFSEAISAMAGEQRPKIVLFGSQSVPRTHTGKVQRRKLQSLFEPYAACRGTTQMLSV